MRGLTVGAALLAGWAQVVRAQAPAQQPPRAGGEHARRLLDDALLASARPRELDFAQDLVARFKRAADAAPRSAPVLLDHAIALDRAASLVQA